MTHILRHLRPTLALCMLILLAACSQDSNTTGDAAAPSGDNTDATATAQKPRAVGKINAPAGQYKLDINHASLSFSVKHLGLSNYIVRFSDYDVRIDLSPDNMQQSSIQVDVNPASVYTGYTGDYPATHPDAEYDTWEKTLAKSDKFFNTGQYPKVSFKSTTVEPLAPGRFRVRGDLTLLGQTHPLTLEAKVVGSVAEHPLTGKGALGFSAHGSFKRSKFGMDYLLEPRFVSDRVNVHFEGEFNQLENSTQAPDSAG